MQFQIQTRGLPRAADLRLYANIRLQAVLARFADAITAVTVRLGDINGPERGGVDKICRVVVEWKNHSALVIEELGSDIAVAIDRASGRLEHLLARQPGYRPRPA